MKAMCAFLLTLFFVTPVLADVDDTIHISTIYEANADDGEAIVFKISFDYSYEMHTGKAVLGIDTSYIQLASNIELQVLSRGLTSLVAESANPAGRKEFSLEQGVPISLSSEYSSSGVSGTNVQAYSRRSTLNLKFIRDDNKIYSRQLYKDGLIASALSVLPQSDQDQLYKEKLSTYSSKELTDYFITLYTSNDNEKVNRQNKILFDIISARGDFGLLLHAIAKALTTVEFQRDIIYPLDNEAFLQAFREYTKQDTKESYDAILDFVESLQQHSWSALKRRGSRPGFSAKLAEMINDEVKKHDSKTLLEHLLFQELNAVLAWNFFSLRSPIEYRDIAYDMVPVDKIWALVEARGPISEGLLDDAYTSFETTKNYQIALSQGSNYSRFLFLVNDKASMGRRFAAVLAAPVKSQIYGLGRLCGGWFDKRFRRSR